MTTDSNQKKYSSEELRSAYEDGFNKGNAGMDSSYCSHRYLSSAALKRKWINGWKAGCKSAGISHANPSKSILWGLLILLLLSIIGYFNYRNLTDDKYIPIFSITASKTSKPDSSNTNDNTSSSLTSKDQTNKPEKPALSENIQARKSTRDQSFDAVLQKKQQETKIPVPTILSVDVIHSSTKIESASALESNDHEAKNEQELKIKEPSSATFKKDVQPIKKELLSQNQETIIDNNDTTSASKNTSNESHSTSSLSSDYLKLKITSPLFTHSVVDRVPGEALEKIDNNEIVYFYTNIRNFKDHSIRHQWVFNDQIINQKKFLIRGNRWRIYTAYVFPASSKGTLTTQVYADDNILIHEYTIDVDIPKESQVE